MASNSRASVKECIDLIYQRNIIDLDYAYDRIGKIYDYVSQSNLCVNLDKALNIMLRSEESGLLVSDDVDLLKEIYSNVTDLSVYITLISRELYKITIHEMYRVNKLKYLCDTNDVEFVTFGIIAYLLLRNTKPENREDIILILVDIFGINHRDYHTEDVVDELRKIYRFSCFKSRCRLRCIAMKEYNKSYQRLLNYYTEAKKATLNNRKRLQ